MTERRTVEAVRTCVLCHATFASEHGEAAFMRARGLKLPARCPECRHRAKQEQEAALAALPGVEGPPADLFLSGALSEDDDP